MHLIGSAENWNQRVISDYSQQDNQLFKLCYAAIIAIHSRLNLFHQFLKYISMGGQNDAFQMRAIDSTTTKK